MNYWWLVSGGIGLVTAFIHLTRGQFDVIKPFLHCDLAAVPKATLHACWHMVTVILFASAIALLYLGVNPIGKGSNVLALFIGGQFVAYAIVFLVIALAGNWSKKTNPPNAVDPIASNWSIVHYWELSGLTTHHTRPYSPTFESSCAMLFVISLTAEYALQDRRGG
ncbi:MAG: hypothetical protein KOO62_12065 [candidate division Zixibacteria bacterium]|nr:hypothetical protein [candidate division Zixibacteria bacterium]